jgi:hypothetical protein
MQVQWLPGLSRILCTFGAGAQFGDFYLRFECARRFDGDIPEVHQDIVAFKE